MGDGLDLKSGCGCDAEGHLCDLNFCDGRHLGVCPLLYQLVGLHGEVVVVSLSLFFFVFGVDAIVGM